MTKHVLICYEVKAPHWWMWRKQQRRSKASVEEGKDLDRNHRHPQIIGTIPLRVSVPETCGIPEQVRSLQARM